ncbi:tubulin-like doman-containing protein [Fimbriimonas ginsengisoli]|uniref:Tubulin like n=1 Tax=Fimbriimonas ginsengisoli Gsoil 348 TaxID=661478 RepID=A0A068NRP9_FIMGI|nr:tubulin-like doman-containing protein [Fimbriimonas ginsengisoli]AIE86032.1 hypothetical protein OP10G_2664 [Fimbriimonas ginsengisoli Gsoil 348]
MPSPTPITVNKTIVVGLGSTGTQICNEIADRLRWEYGSLDQVPWVKFLCIETDVNEPMTIDQAGAQIHLAIESSDWDSLAKTPERHDETIRLSEWSHKGTLQKLPNSQISAGAGNIRMVGRVALMYSRNFERVKAKLSDLVNQIRPLSATQAESVLGQLRDGTAPSITFQNASRSGRQDNINFFVVGSLCGGTSGGISPDFGLLIKKLSGHSGDDMIAMFSLPRPSLGSQRLKKNAYTSLVELNHYSLMDPNDPPIYYADKSVQRSGDRPYSQIYLLMPRQERNNLEALNSSIADVVFLNIVAPQTGTAGTRADIAPLASGNSAYEFSTVGLAYLEFPAIRIVEACSKRLAAKALKAWCMTDETQVAKLQADLGITWESIYARIAGSQSGGLWNLVETRIRQIAEMARTNPTQARQDIRNLRESFVVLPTAADWPGAGSVPALLGKAAQSFGAGFGDGIKEWVKRNLMSMDAGPVACHRALLESQKALYAMAGASLGQLKASTAEKVLDELTKAEPTTLSRFLGVKSSNKESLIAQLTQALVEEFKSRLDMEVMRHFVDSQRPDGTKADGLAKLLASKLDGPVRKLEAASTRLQALAEELDSKQRQISRQPVSTQGIVLFDPEADAGGNGTVFEEYTKVLDDRVNQRGWTIGEAECFRDIVAALDNGELRTQLVADVNLEGASVQEDWLRRNRQTNDEAQVPEVYEQALTSVSRAIFEPILQENVLDRWYRQHHSNDSRRTSIAQLVSLCSSYLDVSMDYANAGAREALVEKLSVLLPQSPRRQDFAGTLQSLGAGEWKEQDSPEKYRVILIRHSLGFPLSACTEISGPGSLAEAQSNDFPTFHTRKDIAWRLPPVPPSPSDLRLAPTLAMAVMLNFAKIRNSFLEVETPAEGFREPITFQLPTSIELASRKYGRDQRDVTGKQMPVDMETRLREKIESKRAESNDVEFVQGLVDAYGTKKLGRALTDNDQIGKYLTDYLRSDERLKRALVKVVQITPERKHMLFRAKGRLRDEGDVFEQDGYYCPKCEELIGATEDEAAEQLWQCRQFSEHYYGPTI